MEAENSLSTEETDNLHRSTKKQKQVSESFPQAVYATLKEMPTESSSQRKSLFPHEDWYKAGEKDTKLEGSEDFDSDEEFLRKLDPLCPIVKLSRMEKKCICIPWKRAIIVNLLGKKIGLRMLQTWLMTALAPGCSSREAADVQFLLPERVANEILEVPDKSLVGPIKSPSVKHKTASNDMGKSHQESVAASDTTRQLRGNNDKSSIAEDNGRDLPLSHNGNNELTGRKVGSSRKLVDSDTASMEKGALKDSVGTKLKGRATWPFVSHGDLGKKEFAYVENNVRISMSSMGLDQSSLGLAHASSYKPPDGILIGGAPTGSPDPTCSPNQQQDDIISNMDCEVNPSEDCVVIDTLETMVSPTPSLS
ncbi:hypothetical protein SESBI_24219 [Sesbania bispinosa]|nr:hypothetical protein SESBI_24219 [Sesbania bispinosa]